MPSCPCDLFIERCAIIEFDGGEEPEKAARLARIDVCLGCHQKLGIDLFNIEELDD